MFRGRILFYFILTLLATAKIEEKEENVPMSSKREVTVNEPCPEAFPNRQSNNNCHKSTTIETKAPDTKTSSAVHSQPLEFKEKSVTTETNQPLPITHPRSKSCFHTSAFTSVCPEGFKLISKDNESLCYIIKEDQLYPPFCPYPNFLPYHRVKTYLLKDFFNKIIWVLAYRDNESGFPDFTWIENSPHYGEVMAEDLTNPNDDEYGKHCVVSKSGHLRRVSCSDTYSSLCMYSMDELTSLYLNQICYKDEYEKCIFGNFDLSRPTCFCKKINECQPTKAQFCDKLAEPVYPFQSELITKNFGMNSGMCWIGLYKEESDLGVNYKWLSTDTNVNYTRWAKPEDCRFSEGAFRFSSGVYDGWILTNDTTLKCAICEFSTYYKQCSLQLKYDPRTDEVELTINNFESISSSSGLKVYCFSDSNSDGFSHHVDLVINTTKQKDNRILAKLATISDYPSSYWCEAFQYFSNKVTKSNTIITYKRCNGYGNEFAIHVSVQVSVGIDPFLNKIHLQALRYVSKKLSDYQDIIQNLRPMRATFNETSHRMYMLIHLTTMKTGQSAADQHNKLYIALNNISVGYPIINVTEFLCSEVCLPSSTETPDGLILEWPETRIGAKAIPYNLLCLDENNGMVPVIRKCEGEFLHGAKWAEPEGTCNKNTTYSEITLELFDLLHSNTSSEILTADLERISQQNIKNELIDVHLMSSVLEKLVVEFKEETDSDSFLKIVSNIMNFDRRVVKDAQILLNSTDKILSSLDDFLENRKMTSIVTSKLIVQISDLTTNVSGLALYTDALDPIGFESYTVVPLFQNISFNNLIRDESLETAVLIPNTFLQRSEFSLSQDSKLVIIIFYNDLLFNELEYLNVTQKSKTKIISVTVSRFNGSLRRPLRVAFKLPKNYLNTKNCSYWNYGVNTNMVSVHGKWETELLSQGYENSIEVCEFFHMTHFGLLLQGDLVEGPYKRSLEILIALGSALSLIGIIPIFLTACLFKSWRCRSGNIILLNFCIAIIIKITLTFLLYTVEEDGGYCTFIGACLHYADLSEFCWMFVIALLQYRRFVTVFKPHKEHLVGKCLLIGWLTPLPVVVITISISTENYRMNAAGYCYVVDDYFIYACLVPISIVLIVNIFIFIVIIYSISRQNAASCLPSSHSYKLEILLVMFLFFTLGLTWIFYFIGLFGGGIIFIYLFCVTSTLRGLVLFLFFILGNKEIRQLWIKRFSYYVSKDRRDSGAMKCSNAGTVYSD